MKTTRLLIIILTLLVACNSKKEQPADVRGNTTESDNKKDANQSDQPGESEADGSGAGGVWVNEKYIEKLKRTKSPRESQSAAEASLIILPDRLNEKASLIWGFHEGTNGVLRKDGGQLGIYTSDKGVADHIVEIKNDKLKLKDNQFIRSSMRMKDRHPIAEEFLFAGTYLIGEKTIQFTPDGKITGLDSLNMYSVFVDYADAGMQVDQIEVGLNGDMKTYGFKFRKDDLILYHLRCLEKEQNLCLEVENGPEYMRLKKK